MRLTVLAEPAHHPQFSCSKAYKLRTVRGVEYCNQYWHQDVLAKNVLLLRAKWSTYDGDVLSSSWKITEGHATGYQHIVSTPVPLDVVFRLKTFCHGQASKEEQKLTWLQTVEVWPFQQTSRILIAAHTRNPLPIQAWNTAMMRCSGTPGSNFLKLYAAGCL